MGLFKANRPVTLPPARYASGPTLTGKTTEKLFDDPFELQRFCHQHGGAEPARRAGDNYWTACYIPALDLVVLPSRKAWPSKKEIEEMRQHEWAHARGWPGDHPQEEPRNVFSKDGQPETKENLFRRR